MLKSIRSKLVIWYLCLFSIVFSGLGLFLHYRLKGIVIGTIDDHLHSEVQFIASLLEEERGKIEFALSDSGVVGDYALPLSGHYYQVISSDGRVIARSPSLSIIDASLPILEGSSEPSYRVITGPDKAPLRMLIQSFRLPQGVVTIQASESLENSYRLIASFRNTILLVFSSIFISSIAGIQIITNLSLRGLNTLSRKVGQITEKNLKKRIEGVKVDRELQPLVEGFNAMLSRLNNAFTIQRRFLSDASHELRTPTSVIKSYCDVTLNKERTQAQYQEVLHRISEAVNRMSDTINKILEVSRLESKEALLRKGEVNINSLLESVYKLMLPVAEGKGVKLFISDEGDVIVIGDIERLTEVFINLVDNAIKYNRDGGEVIISSRKESGFVIITVSDTGIGIPEEDLSRIFDRFYRVDKSRGEVQGAGLGLSIAKAIVDAHKGRMEVKSRIGEGSEFRVLLPLFAG